jgi:pimeloyl-ACP methyl ester carboxylesterase
LTHGIPVFGQLAGAVAAAGYAVVRYDGRGVGQSGGRTESAGLPEYSDDVLAVIAWLKKRKQVNADRIALVAYSESGPIAMLAATREKRVKGLGLLATPGSSGREVTMEQQERLLSALRMPEADRKARIALQTRVNEAVATGKGWENIPADVRRQADSPFFRTWLLFDPAAAIKKLKQPIFIAQGSLDTEIPPAHADRLEHLSLTARKVPVAHTQKLVVSGVNHLLVPAATGSIDEYASLEGETIAPAISGALVAWLQTVLAGD